ncbi:Spy/CpxP family protein refolding chaperone [Microbulbifer sp. OS29]|uniref:Spy/CpxP family protein refolding chaperone n=1 Tax=Microbulbifer okhotskensis TaxID=2926617 RepID=A0A9X2ELV6_9GAMM|nr:Spy/CpxP family protein refolding chaperone [Microbulbifer okhotskensis]MCO1333955.1 Spy/CpxP family protein refolding chaperone [Microbulbifer okhotskensis]
MKNWKMVVGSFALAGVMVVPAVSMACDNARAHGRAQGPEKIAKELQLTEAQRAELKEYRGARRESKLAQREQMHKLRGEIREAIQSGADQATLANLGAELGKLEVAKMQRRNQMLERFESVLTEEQLAKLESLKAEKKKRHMKKGKAFHDHG